MAQIFCAHNVQHGDISSARHCKGHPVVLPALVPERLMVTQPQLDYIEKLGGDVRSARHLTRKGASTYIDQLKKASRRSPVTVAPAPQPANPKTAPLSVPLSMLAAVPEGRYAVRPDSDTPWTFVRLSRPRKGQFAGCTKIQTQHGENLDLKMIVRANGNTWRATQTIESSLLLVIVGWQQAAIDYGREIGRCCRCATELTDERSRWYGIGPDCEKLWSWLIPTVDEQVGTSFYPGIKEALASV